MGFLFVVLGLLMIVAGARDTYVQFGQQVAGDFTGPGNFTYWLASIGVVGALGYIPTFKEFSRYFMALIVIAMVLANKGLFDQFNAFLKSGPVAANAPNDNGSSGATTPTITQNSSSTDINAAISNNQKGLFGQSPATDAQGKFNGWMNYIFGTGTKTAQ